MINRRRLLVFGILSLFMISMFAGVVVADAAADIEGATKTVSESLKGAVTGVVEGLFGNQNETAVIKTLFFILVFLIVVTILGVIPLFKDKNGTKILIALVVTILSVMYIPTELIKPMLNPYSAFGIAIISIIPFVLLWIFTATILHNSFLRKITWMFYAVALLALTIYTSIDIPMSGGSWAAAIAAWIYGGASVLALLMVFFSDWIEKNIWKGKMQTAQDRALRRSVARHTHRRMEEQEAAAEGLPVE